MHFRNDEVHSSSFFVPQVERIRDGRVLKSDGDHPGRGPSAAERRRGRKPSGLKRISNSEVTAGRKDLSFLSVMIWLLQLRV